MEWNQRFAVNSAASLACLDLACCWCLMGMFQCRTYPPQFGARLVRIWHDAPLVENRSLRRVFEFEQLLLLACVARSKPLVSKDRTDRELFESLELQDTWSDANLFAVFDYLYQSSGTMIPDSWRATMSEFHMAFRNAVVASDSLVDEYNNLVKQHASYLRR